MINVASEAALERCPECGGRGTVLKGLYDKKILNEKDREPCRRCLGAGHAYKVNTGRWCR